MKTSSGSDGGKKKKKEEREQYAYEWEEEPGQNDRQETGVTFTFPSLFSFLALLLVSDRKI